jgi:hypothetical protein
MKEDIDPGLDWFVEKCLKNRDDVRLYIEEIKDYNDRILARYKEVVKDGDPKKRYVDWDRKGFKLILDAFEYLADNFIEPYAATDQVMARMGLTNVNRNVAYMMLEALISSSYVAGCESVYVNHDELGLLKKERHRQKQIIRGRKSGKTRRANSKWARVDELRREISAKNPTLSAPQLAQKIRDRLKSEGSKKPPSVDWMARQIRKQSGNRGEPGSVPRQ